MLWRRGNWRSGTVRGSKISSPKKGNSNMSNNKNSSHFKREFKLDAKNKRNNAIKTLNGTLPSPSAFRSLSFSLSHTLSLSALSLLQRYQNVKAELEAQQNLERVRMEKLVQSGALTSSRRMKSSKSLGNTGGSAVDE